MAEYKSLSTSDLAISVPMKRTQREQTPKISRLTLVRCALALKGSTVSDFARQQGLSFGYVYKILRGEKKASPELHAAIEAVIAKHR